MLKTYHRKENFIAIFNATYHKKILYDITFDKSLNKQIFDIERSGEIRKSVLLFIEIVIKVLKLLFLLIMLLIY